MCAGSSLNRSMFIKEGCSGSALFVWWQVFFLIPTTGVLLKVKKKIDSQCKLRYAPSSKISEMGADGSMSKKPLLVRRDQMT